MGREWEEGSGRNRREEEDLLWEENGKKGVEGIEGKKRICCGKRMGRRDGKENKGRRICCGKRMGRIE